MLDDLRLAWRFALAARSKFTWRIALTSSLAAVALLLGCVGMSVAQGFAHVTDVSHARSWDIVDSRDDAVALVRRDVVQLGGHSIEILRVAPLRDGSIEFPGLDGMPPTGAYAVSPAVKDLLAASPSLHAFMPVANVIGSEGVASGAERFAIRRVPAAAIAGREAVPVSGFGHSVPQEPSTVAVVPTWAPVVAVLLLLGLPMVLLLSTASRLAAAVREHRMLLMSKLGARRRATSVAVLESLLLMAPGLIVGILVWAVGFARIRHVPFVGSPLLEGAWRWTPAHWWVLAAALITIGVSARAVARPRRVVTTQEAERVSPARTSLFAFGVALLLITPWLSSANRPRLYLLAVCVAALGIAVALPYWLHRTGEGMRVRRRALPLFVAGSRLARFPRRHARGWAALAVACAIFSPALVMVELNAQGDTDEQARLAPELSLYKVELTDPRSDISQLRDGLASQHVGWLYLTGNKVGISGTCREVARAVDARGCTELSRMLSTVVPWADQIRFVKDSAPPKQRLAVVISKPDVDALTDIASVDGQVPLSSVTELSRNVVKDSPLVPWILGGIAVAICAAMLAILVLVVDRSMMARQITTLSRIGLSLRKRRLIDAVTFVTACWVSAGAGLGIGVLAAIVLSRDEFAGLFPWQGLSAMVGLVLALSVVGGGAVSVGSVRAQTSSSGRS